ncbi:MAG: oligosaccharide flippase family protein [Methylophilaceae bacterium]|nr:MAG: oligosaccharide flippase family protein [Methylophilaceae bacterium]
MLKRNIIFNFLGNGYVVILQFALVPFLLKYLGAEAYGLVGVYLTLLASISMLDMGLSPALSRELARLSALPNSVHLIRSTVTTLESIYFFISLTIIIFFYLTSSFIAEHWLIQNQLPKALITDCLILMGSQCSLQFLTNYYNNGLVGLQQMARANIVLSINHTIRAFAGLSVLIFLPPNLTNYFFSQLLATFIGLLLTAYSLYCVLPIDEVRSRAQLSLISYIKGRFSIERFNATKKFAAGMAVISTCSILVMQADKIILSKLIPLDEFGYYTIAVSIAVTIAGGAGLISKAVLPRLTQLVATHNTETIKKVYLNSSSLVAWVILPLSGLLIIFSQEFLTLYLGSEHKAVIVAPVFSLLMIGYAIHSLQYIPYALSLAYGWTRYGINVSLVSMLLMPISILGALKYGVLGAAAGWVIISILYLCFTLNYLHKNILSGLMWLFYKKVSLPILILIICVLLLIKKQGV